MQRPSGISVKGWAILLGLSLGAWTQTASAQGIIGSGAAEGAEVPHLRRQIPWFKDPDVLAYVNLNKRQYGRLEADYIRLWTRYDAALKDLDAELEEEARAARAAEIEKEFDDSFTRSLDNVITDERARKRYEQLYRQYQGYSVFRNSQLREQLNLSGEQLDELMRADKAWWDEIAVIRDEFAKNRPAAMRQLKHARHRMNEQIAKTLTPEQMLIWQDLTGDPYEFSAQTYFPAKPTAANKPVPPPPAPKKGL